MSKKTVIIILSVVLSVLAALTAVIILSVTTKRVISDNSENDNSSSGILSVFQSEETDSEDENENSEPAAKEKELQISSPSSKNIYTTENKITFTGTSDSKYPLTLNGKEVERDENGLFSITKELKEGKNTFEFNHKKKTLTYTVNYRFVIIKSYNPTNSQTYSSGSTLSVSVVARKGSSVSATFNGSTVSLKEYNPQQEEGEKSETFVSYIGSFKLPSNNKANVNLGKIKFSASYKGRNESFYSGSITCKKPDIKVTHSADAAPKGGKYINVGKGKITEIIAYEAETFDAYSTDDMSRPTNNYLPKGTVDYSAEGYIYYEGSTRKEYALLRYGRQVYTSRKDTPTNQKIAVVKEYSGTLPDHNEIKIASFKNNGSHTVLTLDTLWKAPFYFDILPQKYSNPSKQDYRVSSVTSQYIDITLCYTTVLKGNLNIPSSNPIFKNAKIIKNKSDYTIRLYLKKQGGFYGWDASYNQAGQLVFEFLNPKKVEKANNYYGVNLSGAKIFIDVGHGGADPGALGFDGKNHNEAIQNLTLAKKIKAELEKIGATVYMSRTSSSTVSNDKKIQMLKSLKPDFCIAVHHNSATTSSANGFDAYYSHPFSKKAAELIKMHTQNTGIYKNYGLDWHYYFLARSSYCPVVLTENGFISNSNDYKNIINSDKNTEKAKAIVKGIAEYFLYISPKEAYTPDTDDESSDSTEEKPSDSSSAPSTSSTPESSGNEESSSSGNESSSSEESSSDNSSSDSSDASDNESNDSSSSSTELNLST